MAELQAKHEKQIKAAIAKLNKALAEVREYIPEANFYLEDAGSFNVLSGSSHSEDDWNPNHDNVLACFSLKNSSGGSW